MPSELIAPELLQIVRCPRCRGELKAGTSDLECAACRLAYAVVDGVPNFLVEDARSTKETR